MNKNTVIAMLAAFCFVVSHSATAQNRTDYGRAILEAMKNFKPVITVPDDPEEPEEPEDTEAAEAKERAERDKVRARQERFRQQQMAMQAEQQRVKGEEARMQAEVGRLASELASKRAQFEKLRQDKKDNDERIARQNIPNPWGLAESAPSLTTIGKDTKVSAAPGSIANPWDLPTSETVSVASASRSAQSGNSGTPNLVNMRSIAGLSCDCSALVGTCTATVQKKSNVIEVTASNYCAQLELASGPERTTLIAAVSPVSVSGLNNATTAVSVRSCQRCKAFVLPQDISQKVATRGEK